MVLLRTIAVCTGASSNTILDYNLVRFGVCMIKLCHERMLILRCILPPPPKKMNYLQKKSPPPPRHHHPFPKIAKPSLKQSQTLELNLTSFPKNPNPL